MRTPPKKGFSYSGLAIVLSNPSRFDNVSLLSANGGHMFNNFCLRPDYNTMQCDVRLADETELYLPNTKCVLVLGESAMHKLIPETRGNSLGEMRGSIFLVNGIPHIPSFFPQDAVEMKNWEKEHNPLSQDYAEDESVDEDDDDDVKRHGRTSRKNYAFWLRADTRKAKRILKDGIPKKEWEPVYKIYPPSQEVINVLTNTKNCWMDFDIETDFEDQNLQCFAFSLDEGRTVYCVPILDFNYSYAYGSVPHIMRALAVAFRDNVVVAHNGATFDFFVMAYKYRIPVNKPWDTMIAMHRCFPDVEKSLGHCTSYWTNEKFHKDEDSHGYMTREQMMARMKYCGKDVYTMSLIRQAIMQYAKTIPGLTDSIETAMKSIKPYLITSLQGIRYDQQLVNEKKAENDQLMMQYMRIINLLIGESGMSLVNSVVKKSKSSFPGSNKKCCQYFHELLGYPVVGRGKPSEKDGTRNPSLAKKAMFKLRLKHDNPVIDFCLAYRQVALETSTPLGFIPWKNDDGQIINKDTYGIPTVPKSNFDTPTLL